jgi:hypothetical protein
MSESTGASYTGPSGGLKKPSQWLASEDLNIGTEVKVTIEDVLRHKGLEFDKGRKEDIGTIKFQGRDKQLVLNATNRKKLVAMFGTDTKEWRGKSIAIYVETGVRLPTGGKGLGLRVKEAAQ